MAIVLDHTQMREPEAAPLPAEADSRRSTASRRRSGDLLRRRLELAMVGDPDAVRRLSRANTSVAFRMTGSEVAVATLLLNPGRPQVVDGVRPAEITVELTPSDADRMGDGSTALAVAILEGRVTYSGPIRRYLSVDPILRELLSRGRSDTAES